MTTRPRGVFVSDSYFKGGRFLDPTRSSLLKEMSKFCSEISYIQANDFPVSNGSESAPEETVFSLISKIDPGFIFTINGAGLTDEVSAYAQKKSIPVLTWFIDSTNLISQELVQNARKGLFYHGCLGFDHLPEYNTRKYWLPFSTIAPSFDPNQEGEKDISFLGTSWHILHLAQAASLGLALNENEHFLSGKELYEYLTQKADPSQTFVTRTGQKIPTGQLLNMLASQKRSHALKCFEEFDLHIYGEEAWYFNLWPVAPSLLRNFSVRYALDHHELGSLMREHKVSLNIFHPHNLHLHGGPNFRALDSFTHGVPMLSEYNPGCAELFPEGECALYFKSPDEGVLKAKELLTSKSLRMELVKSAADRIREGFLHEHRINRFFSDAGLDAKKENELEIHVYSKRLYPEMFRSERIDSKQLIASVDYTKTNEFEIEKFYYSLAHSKPKVEIPRGKIYRSLRSLKQIWLD